LAIGIPSADVAGGWASIPAYVSSPQSKEGDDRKEEKLDYIIKQLDPKNYDKLIKEWEQKYPKN
jgi:hypothetical protein